MRRPPAPRSANDEMKITAPIRKTAFLGFLLLCSCRASAVLEENLVQRCADQILRHQTSDGALAMSRISERPAHVIPYFANLASIGLISAYRQTHRIVLRDAVRRWVDWYEAHLNAAGTIFDYNGAPGMWQSTGAYDSVDSYAATYLELVWDVYQSDRDRSWLGARAPAILKVMAPIRRVLQPNGLTIAKPTYPVMYTMDNVETSRGLRAAAQIEGVLGEKKEAVDAGRLASAMENAVAGDLWDPVRLCYRVDIQTDGGKDEGLANWYPNVMANLMAVAWLPAGPRNRSLFRRLKDSLGKDLPTMIRSEEDLERLVWWASAAKGAGDAALLEKVKRLLEVSSPTVFRLDDLAMSGHICRLYGR